MIQPSFVLSPSLSLTDAIVELQRHTLLCMPQPRISGYEDLGISMVSSTRGKSQNGDESCTGSSQAVQCMRDMKYIATRTEHHVRYLEDGNSIPAFLALIEVSKWGDDSQDALIYLFEIFLPMSVSA